ncbi:MAG: extracellular solute-binding protein [Clostridia bacterium]
MKKIPILSLTLIILFSLIGCNSSNETTETIDSTNSPTPTISTEVTDKPNNSSDESYLSDEYELPDPSTAETLTVYLTNFDDEISTKFYNDTGYKVEIVTCTSQEIQTLISDETNTTVWDVLLIDSLSSMYQLNQNEELFANWVPQNIGNILDKYLELIPDNCSYYPICSYATGVIVYNANTYTALTAPQSYDDLLDESSGYTIGFANASMDYSAYSLVSYLFNKYSDDNDLFGGYDYFNELIDEGAMSYPSNEKVIEYLETGRINIALLPETLAFSLTNSNPIFKMIYPENGTAATVQVAGISASSQNTAVAKLFIEYLLESDTQQELIQNSNSFFYEVCIDDVIETNQRRLYTINLEYTDPQWSAINEEEILYWFDYII